MIQKTKRQLINGKWRVWVGNKVGSWRVQVEVKLTN
jgi:hypothetical protein